jgi:hypothetical protein
MAVRSRGPFRLQKVDSSMQRVLLALAALGAGLALGWGNPAQLPSEESRPSAGIAAGAPDTERDITEGGRYVWGYNSRGDYVVVEIEGEAVPEQIDHEKWYANRAAAAGVTLDQFKADLKARTEGKVFGEEGLDVDSDLEMPVPGAPVAKASHHPAYQYGIMGLGTSFVRGTNVGMSSCTCTGVGGTVGGSVPSSQLAYSCQLANSGSHTTPACLFPRTKTWTYYMGDNARWGGFLTYFRARMVEASFRWNDNFDFHEVTTPIGSGANLDIYPGNGTVASATWLAHTQFQGTAIDEGDLPIQNVQRQSNAKAFSYAGAAINISTDRLEAESDRVQRLAGILPPFDFTNAYANVLAHEMGHVRSLVHFTNAPAGSTEINLMVPGCAGKPMLGDLHRGGGMRGGTSFFNSFTSALNVNASGNGEAPLAKTFPGPYAFTAGANVCSSFNDGEQFDFGTPE